MWYSLFHRIVYAFKWLFGLAAYTSKLPPWLYQAIHAAIVVVTTLVLGWFSPQIVPESWLPDPTVFGPFIRRFYCGILFVLFYAFIRLLAYLIRLFLMEDVSEFEDIDRAWNAGMDALARAGLDVQLLPLFPVIGLTGERERNFFSAAGMAWSVQPGPEEGPLVLHFYANNDAVFVSCSEVGATSRQVRQAGQVWAGGEKPEPRALQDMKTVRADEIQRQQEKTVLMSAAGGGGSHTLMPGQVGHTMAPPQAAAARPLPSSASQKLSSFELAEERRRLEHLCRLMIRERAPFCPINGLQVVLPLAWSASSKAQELLVSSRQDLETLHAELEQQFPVICSFAGLEELPGVLEFVERGGLLDGRFRDSRAGSHFPLGHAVDDQAGEWTIERGFQWFRGWIYAQFAKDLTNRANPRLYRLLCDLDERRTRLVRQLTLTFGETVSAGKVWLAGCYFCACGSDGRPRAFVHGILQKLISEQDSVSWSPHKLRRDSRCRTWAAGLFVGAALLAAADVVLFWLWRRSAGP